MGECIFGFFDTFPCFPLALVFFTFLNLWVWIWVEARRGGWVSLYMRACGGWERGAKVDFVFAWLLSLGFLA
jgi:hypothetical protein